MGTSLSKYHVAVHDHFKYCTRREGKLHFEPWTQNSCKLTNLHFRLKQIHYGLQYNHLRVTRVLYMMLLRSTSIEDTSIGRCFAVCLSCVWSCCPHAARSRKITADLKITCQFCQGLQYSVNHLLLSNDRNTPPLATNSHHLHHNQTIS